MSGQDSSDERPRYAIISDTLRLRVEDGQYPVGTLLPTESELCAEFGISRHTVREALRRLADNGLIRRRQGSGSLVVATSAHPSYVHSMHSLNELFQYAADTRFRIGTVRMVIPDADDANDLGDEAGEEWLLAEGIRLEHDSDVPICFTRVFINRDFAAIAADLPRVTGAVYRQIEDRFGVEVAFVDQDIAVVPIPPQAASVLGKKARSWAVRVVRRYLDAEARLLLVSVNYHPADRFSYSMRLRREGPKGAWG